MLIFRFLIFYLLSLVGVAAVYANDAVVPQTGEKPKPAPTAEAGIEMTSVNPLLVY